MKQLQYIALCAAVISSSNLLSSCSDDITAPHYTVGEADNAIVLHAGISEGGSTVQTRAVTDPDASHAGNANGGAHTLFTEGTYARLRVDGQWKKTTSGTADDVRKTTTIKLKGKASDSGNDAMHNLVDTYDPQLYWDDYGTADPNNKEEGRKRGLDIFGVAVDGYKNGSTAALPTDLNLNNEQSGWTSLSWTLETDQKQKGWKDKDLLISNNVKYSTTDAEDNAYKFDSRSSGKLLEFKHAMSKITFVLTPGDGFPVVSGGTAKKFENTPSVTLTSREAGDNTTAEWAQTTGTVNVESGATNLLTTQVPAAITLHHAGTDNSTQVVTLNALVFPGSEFEDNATIACINADGNVYYVTSAAIRTKMHEVDSSTDYKTASGKNYIFNITVNKTSIDVTATVKNWENVNAANEAPIINISKCYGQPIGDKLSDFAKDFNFYRSTSKDGSYLGNEDKAVVNWDGTNSKYTMSPQLYWPNHSTHYFFRGIWPKVGSADQTDINAEYTPTAKVTHDNDATTIAVQNVPYKAETFPSDLMIGMPRNADGTPDEKCKVEAHKTGTPAKAPEGICATDAVSDNAHDSEGLIHMNFQYAMSQVVVELTTNTGATNAVTFDANTKVEIINGYKEGALKLADGKSDFTNKTPQDYNMNKIADTDYDSYHDAIIPQSLEDESHNATLKFRITVGNGTDNDVYETVLGIKNIKVTEGGSEKNITAWEPGKKYTYTLTITKTDISAVATIKNWVEVKADSNVWF